MDASLARWASRMGGMRAGSSCPQWLVSRSASRIDAATGLRGGAVDDRPQGVRQGRIAFTHDPAGEIFGYVSTRNGQPGSEQAAKQGFVDRPLPCPRIEPCLFHVKLQVFAAVRREPPSAVQMLRNDYYPRGGQAGDQFSPTPVVMGVVVQFSKEHVIAAPQSGGQLGNAYFIAAPHIDDVLERRGRKGRKE